MLNKPIVGYMEIQKLSSVTHKKLAGAEFQVWKDMDGNDGFNPRKDKDMGMMTEGVDADGKGTGIHTIENLPKGHYFMQELVAPEDHIRSTTIYRFDITRDGEKGKLYYLKTATDGAKTKVYLSNNTVSNRPVGTLTLLKTDEETKKPLAEAEFTVFKDAECTTIVDTQVTDENGQAQFSKLLYGTYYLVETKAPEGYVADRTPIEFKVNSPTVNLGNKYNNNEIPNKLFRFHLPETGGNIPMYLIPIIAVLLGAGIWFLIKSRKKH